MTDSHNILENLRKENLSNYFILPLLKLNKGSFVAEENFIDSFLSANGEYIYVQLREVTFFEHRIIMHADYIAMWKDEQGFYYAQYLIPSRWKADLQLFSEGKYSQLSDDAKKLIRLHSGLMFQQKVDGHKLPRTDIRLLALSRSSVLRELWEEHYDVHLADDQELLSLPGGQCYLNKLLFPC